MTVHACLADVLLTSACQRLTVSFCTLLQLAEHNAQIVDLQAAWEQAKVEEEGKGGGAADAKRWTGVRGIVESRELLRTLFKVACDHK